MLSRIVVAAAILGLLVVATGVPTVSAGSPPYEAAPCTGNLLQTGLDCIDCLVIHRYPSAYCWGE